MRAANPLPVSAGLDAELDPERAQALEVPDQGRLRLLRVLLRVDAEADLARAYGTTALSAWSTGSASSPVTVIAGPDQSARPGRRCRRTAGRARPRPARGTRPRCRRRRSTPRGAGRGRRRRRARRAGSRARGAGRSARRAPRRRTGRCASGPASVLASTMTAAMPRSATVSVGTPGRRLPMSPITIASAAKQLGLRRRVGGEALPISSCPRSRS